VECSFGKFQRRGIQVCQLFVAFSCFCSSNADVALLFVNVYVKTGYDLLTWRNPVFFSQVQVNNTQQRGKRHFALVCLCLNFHLQLSDETLVFPWISSAALVLFATDNRRWQKSVVGFIAYVPLLAGWHISKSVRKFLVGVTATESLM